MADLEIRYDTFLTLFGPAFFHVSHEPGAANFSPPPPGSPEASERLVLKMTIVGYPLKNFLRYITCVYLKN